MVEECCGRDVKICKGHIQYMYKKVVFLLCSICVLLLGNSRRLNFICRRFGTLSLSHLHTYPPMKMGQTEFSETSAYKIQTPGNYPEEAHNTRRKSEIKNTLYFISCVYEV